MTSLGPQDEVWRNNLNGKVGLGKTDLEFVMTVAIGGREIFFQKTTRFFAKFVYKYEIYSFIW